MIVLVPIWILAVCLAAAGVVTVIGWGLIAFLAVVVGAVLLLILPIAVVVALARGVQSGRAAQAEVAKMPLEQQAAKRIELRLERERQAADRKVAAGKRLETFHHIRAARAKVKAEERHRTQRYKRRR